MKYILIDVLNMVFRVFYIFPICKNKVVLRSSQGEKYNCNPKYISEYLIKQHPKEFKIVWIFDNPKKYNFLEQSGIILCKSRSLKSIFHLITAKFVIDNRGVQSYLPIRKSQITINTWHGGGSYKKNPNKISDDDKYYFKKRENNTKYYISSCKKFSDNNLANISQEKILPFGMARNDLFFSDTSEIKKKIKKHYNIPENYGLIIFAPTFRTAIVGVSSGINYDIDYKAVIASCEKRFGKKFVFAYRLHELIENKSSELKETQLLSVNDYEDMQELIAAADVIITDYSSLIWDAALAKTPCFIYATDLEDYKNNDRDFYTPIEEWPFPLAQSNDELAMNIEQFDAESYHKALQSHLDAMGSFETGTAAKQIYDFMTSVKE